MSVILDNPTVDYYKPGFSQPANASLKRTLITSRWLALHWALRAREMRWGHCEVAWI